MPHVLYHATLRVKGENMTIQTSTYRVIKIVQPRRPFTNQWRGTECKLPPVYVNDQIKGSKL